MSILNREKVMYSGDRRTILVEAVLKQIRYYLDIEYWNCYQKDMISPFDNTGITYSNDTFTVRAYDWGVDTLSEDTPPNFEYKGFKVWWYKYCGRGMYVKTTHPFTTKFLTKMITDCMIAIDKDFKQRKKENESNNCRRA